MIKGFVDLCVADTIERASDNTLSRNGIAINCILYTYIYIYIYIYIYRERERERARECVLSCFNTEANIVFDLEAKLNGYYHPIFIRFSLYFNYFLLEITKNIASDQAIYFSHLIKPVRTDSLLKKVAS